MAARSEGEGGGVESEKMMCVGGRTEVSESVRRPPQGKGQ